VPVKQDDVASQGAEFRDRLLVPDDIDRADALVARDLNRCAPDRRRRGVLQEPVSRPQVDDLQ
jgi:hypothetical protein